MKKFQFAAGLLALGLMASCSSDAPEVPGNANQTPEKGKGMYLSITLANSDLTRADENEIAGANESKINKIQLLLVNTTNNTLYDSFTATADEINGNTVKFEVSTTEFNQMKLNAANLGVLVYVNGRQTISNLNSILTGKTGDAPWISAAGEGFIMSSDKIYTGLSTSTATGEEDDPWIIKTDVKLTRLASRFDYDSSITNSYSLLSNQDVKMEILGMDVETFAESTYRVPQFSATGEAGAGMVQFAATTDAKYRATDKVTVGEEDENRKAYVDFNYDIAPEEGGHTYARPNSLTTGIKTMAAKDLWRCVPLAVVKAKFNVPTSASMTAKDPVYAINGLYIGGARDLCALKTANQKFAVTTTLTGADKEAIDKIVDKVNDFIDNYMTASTESANLTKIGTDLVALLGASRYTYSNTNSGYICFYSALIEHESNTDLCWKYGVSRNTVYKLGVKSFKFIGAHRDMYPGDEEEETDFSDLYIQLNVSVNPWTLATGNNKWDL